MTVLKPCWFLREIDLRSQSEIIGCGVSFLSRGLSSYTQPIIVRRAGWHLSVAGAQGSLLCGSVCSHFEPVQRTRRSLVVEQCPSPHVALVHSSGRWRLTRRRPLHLSAYVSPSWSRCWWLVYSRGIFAKRSIPRSRVRRTEPREPEPVNLLRLIHSSWKQIHLKTPACNYRDISHRYIVNCCPRLFFNIHHHMQQSMLSRSIPFSDFLHFSTFTW